MSDKEALAVFKKALSVVRARGVASENQDGVAMLILETDRLKIAFTPAKGERPNRLDIWRHGDSDTKVLDVIWQEFEMPMVVTYRGGAWDKMLAGMAEE
jgi:hypothetical protein